MSAALALALLAAQASADGPPPGTGPRGTSGEATRYDEVGYAGHADGARTGVTSAVLSPGDIVEVTAIDTGRTLLLPVVGRTGAEAGPVIGLTQAAATALGVGDAARAPVRVRAVGVARWVAAAIRAGRPGSRLDAPPALLAGLRQKLPAQKLPAQKLPAQKLAAQKLPAQKSAVPKLAATPPQPSPTKRAAVSPPPRPKKQSAARTDPTVGEAPAKAPPIAATPKPVATAKPNASTHGLFVQVAALTNRDRADALARSFHGVVQPAGAAYRVRIGPFADVAAAKRARDGAVAHGYRDARLVRED